MRIVAVATALAVAALGIFVDGDVDAEERRMSAPEIHEALAGNSVEGRWGNTPFQTYFQPNGVMLYKPRGGPLETGKWRIDEAEDLYCSWTARLGWRCYELYRDGRTIIWGVPGGEERYLSRIYGGKAF